MKAAMWYGRNDVRVVETKEPVAAPGTVKVKVKWCGICGSDLHEYLGGPIFIPAEQPHPLSGEKAPVILGHEFSGEVVEVGQGVTKVSVGDRVVVEPMRVCSPAAKDDMCPACREGKYNLCSRLGFHGLCGGGGGFADYTVFFEEFVHPIPDSLSYEDAALVEPMAVALHSLVQGDFKIGQTALVLGAGPIGLCTIEMLKAAGAKKIFVMQRKSIRQEYALKHGADRVLDPNECDVAEEIRSLTGGIGVDVAFETTGAEQGLKLALDSVHYAGTVVVTSIWEKPISFDPNSIVLTEKKLVGTIVYQHQFPAVIRLLSDGRIDTTGLITKKIGLDDIVDEGFGALTGPEKKKHVKIMVTPDEDLL
ncbi:MULTISPECIES: 2,3-butanediol dehydrogenase [Dethiosulfovibrio]|uniref:2,3-butanediol dehydrogenase n=2 Tax=Dethiosulfovibrio TaxID=47054 RepID=A0ABS9EQN8_9BACT|nr:MULTISPECIES: 2,3-butanediol dehydrogenase [Dethiosulfovibrio]MCF4114936.1 2,3-butanediol dehydrogenase [Dethiosulfovibrio russensis]MCF4142457.1 2,3-butanediol dehydrogenase [Dethiosulfovibrio marinus]MCF4145428.1 2,3-butanediol dehydrogenase [Dethiosulfovibrio acidaminovorans]